MSFQVCKRCLYSSDHPLGLTFDEEGICSGCRVHEEKDTLDWSQRLGILKELVRPYRNGNGSLPDCIVPVSGARDSFFIVDFVKNVLGLKPLMVTYNKHYNSDIGIRNLAALQSFVGADMMTMTVSPEKVKAVTKETLYHLGSMYWHCLAGQTVFPVQTAVRFEIPLIIWGAHQGIEQVGMYSHLDEVEMTRKYRHEHDLMGFEAEDLMAISELSEDHWAPYRYPSDQDLGRVNVRGIYLGNYVRWDTKAQHEQMLRKYGYEVEPLGRTMDSYNDVDCIHYTGIHDYIKVLKWGYGKATDHASREIRYGRWSRKEAGPQVLELETQPPEDIPDFLSWIGWSNEQFREIIERHRNPKFWMKTKGEWRLRPEWIESRLGKDAVQKKSYSSIGFESHVRSSDRPKGPILMGRGWLEDSVSGKQREMEQ